MREQPQYKIAKDAVNVWRIHAGIFMAVLWIAILTLIVFTVIYENSYLYGMFAVIVGLISLFFFVAFIPALRYRRWRYEIFDQEIYIQHGILIRTRTLVPMIRVQHVDTEQGPILKKFCLATVSISTAATTHYIPALPEEAASRLRDQISTLARVDEDDV